MKKNVLILGLVAFFSLSARAGLLVDPYIGYGSYGTTADLADAEFSGKGFTALGSRLGYSFLLVSAGIDYEMDTFSDGKRTNMSAFVGVDLPILLRFWAEYTFNSDLQFDDLNSNIDIAFKNGQSFGIGFTGLPFLSINLEIETAKYALEASGGDIDLDWASYLLSVSFPLDF